MTDKPAAVFGNYTDLQFKKGLEVVRITVEIPMSDAADFIEKFGTPNATMPVPVLLAKHNAKAVESDDAETTQSGPSAAQSIPVHKGRKFSELPPSQQCALKCQDQAFQEWLGFTRDECAKQFPGLDPAQVAQDHTEGWVKQEIGITSKKELDTNPLAAKYWLSILTDFDMRSYAPR